MEYDCIEYGLSMVYHISTALYGSLCHDHDIYLPTLPRHLIQSTLDILDILDILSSMRLIRNGFPPLDFVFTFSSFSSSFLFFFFPSSFLFFPIYPYSSLFIPTHPYSSLFFPILLTSNHPFPCHIATLPHCPHSQSIKMI